MQVITPDLPSRRTRRPALPRMPPKSRRHTSLRSAGGRGRLVLWRQCHQPGHGRGGVRSHISYTSPTYREPAGYLAKILAGSMPIRMFSSTPTEDSCRLKQIGHGPGRKSSSPSSRGCTERLDRHLSQRLPGSRPTYGTIRRHGFDGKWCAQLDERHRDPNRQAFRRFTRGDLTRHGASLGSRTAMITAATVRSKPASACCSGMRST